METLKFDVGDDGVALITFDIPGRSMNTLTAQSIVDFRTVLERLKSDDAIKGAVITSGKPSGFCAGADLGEMRDRLGGIAGDDEAALRADFDSAFVFSKLLRELETCGKPIACALNGLALGGGLELALAAHYRVAANGPKVKFGLPEANVGLLPGAGGTQRLPRLVGVMASLPLLLEGKSLGAEQALKAGLVHEVAPLGEIVERARAWVVEKGDPLQPWDRKDFRLPGGAIYSPKLINAFTFANAMLRSKTFGNYPAQDNIMRCVYEGTQAPMDAALRIEMRYFIRTLHTPQAKAMVRSLFLSMQDLAKGGNRPQGIAKSDPRKVGVIGAGMMGAGIAYVQAAAGIETVLIDVDQAGAEAGKDYSRALLDKAVAKGRSTQEEADATLARITPTADYTGLAGADLVIEAVFEDRALKAKVTEAAEAVIGPGALMASNTSTLPITGLAEQSARPANFIGLHFFSPVDRMGLVEIIRGEKTSDESVAKAVDYVLKLRKTPIVVADGRGFYTSRVFGTYLEEGFELLAEGHAPALIDNIGRMTGMPRGPLELADDVALDLWKKVHDQTRRDLGDAYAEPAGDAIVEALVERGRLGRKNGKGLYDYPESGPKTLWPGLADLFPASIKTLDAAGIERVRTRLLYRQAIEAARCVEDGVITDPRDADVGAILGWGFAGWTGGPLSLIDGVGVAEFVARCDQLAADHGDRFAPPRLLREMAATGRAFYDEDAVREQAA